MIAFFCVALMALAGTTLLAFAVNFFWRTGLLRAICYSAAITGAFLAFWGSGIWLGASRHAWGVLAPLFLGLFLAIWLLLVLCFKIIKYLR